MTHQCPKCELKFTWNTELDDHCRSDHPSFQHDYPSSVHNDNSAPVIRVAGQPVHVHVEENSADILSTYWTER